MASQTLLASALFTLLTGTIYAFIGYRLTQRKLPESGRLAAAGFVAFWYGLAVSALLGATGFQALLAAFDSLNLGLVLILGQIGLLAISVALWGLLYYLVYLYTGWRNAWVPIAVFYVGFYLFLQYFLWDAQATGVHAERWTVRVEYQKDLESLGLTDPYLLSLIIGLLVPQILASLAYLTLVFRVRSPTQRYRILLVSLSILAWFGSPFLAIGAGVAENDSWQLISRLIGLAAALTIFIAYYPPGFMRRRFGILSLSDEKRAESPPPEMHEPPQTNMHGPVSVV